ncbi:hypothetical protein CFC21_074041 [Triticum aestivum]|uniref:Uncharacterized protein n=2 Tax=Triticum aestivum TaxID=4565 RepID=A0A9R1HMU9_WHEAT|nr:hypothetical protein CFC21_074041 [Triticum aestivum]
MGSVVGTAASGVGTLLGDAITAPFRAILGASCEGVCSGTWDVACFLEHLCTASLARLFMVIVLTYVVLFFGYLVCKAGIVRCVAKNACKVAGAACSGCCHALKGSSCFLWRKLRDTKRVYHGRRGRRRRWPRDVETGAGDWGSDDEESDGYGGHGHGARRWGRAREGSSSSSSVRERRKDRLRRSLRLRRLVSHKEQYATARSHGGGRHHRGRVVGVPSSTSLRVDAGRKFKRVRT